MATVLTAKRYFAFTDTSAIDKNYVRKSAFQFCMAVFLLCCVCFVTTFAATPYPLDDEYDQTGEYPLPSELTPKVQDEIFGNMPKAYHAATLKKLIELQTSIDSLWESREKFWESPEKLSYFFPPYFTREYERKKEFDNLRMDYVNEEFMNIYDIITKAFDEYPDIFDPKLKDLYWKESVVDLLELLDVRIDCLNKKQNEEQAEWEKLKQLTPENLEQAIQEEQKDIFDFWNFFEWNEVDFKNESLLLKKRIKRLASKKPAFVNPYLGNAPAETLAASQLNEKGEWIDTNDEKEPIATPLLSALRLTVDDLKRWDGSTSLDKVAKTIEAHLCNATVEIEQSWGIIYDERNLDEEHTFELRPNRTLSTLNEKSEIDKEYEKNPIFSFANSQRFSKTHESIVNVIEGKRDISFSTRRPSPDELKLAEDSGVELVVTPFAKDAFVFLVNWYNPVHELTSEQIRGIFGGTIRKWKDVGGFGGEIMALSRNRNSGSEELMRELVMSNTPLYEHRPEMIIQSMRGIFDRLAENHNSIGYSVQYYERYMVTSKSSRVIKIDGVFPNSDTIASGRYPYTYECVFIYRKPKNKGNGVTIDRFVRWTLSDEGQRVIQQSGYVPVGLSVDHVASQKPMLQKAQPPSL